MPIEHIFALIEARKAEAPNWYVAIYSEGDPSRGTYEFRWHIHAAAKPDTSEVYLVLVRRSGMLTSFQIYRADVDRPVAARAVAKLTEDRDSWPPQSVPLAETVRGIEVPNHLIGINILLSKALKVHVEKDEIKGELSWEKQRWEKGGGEAPLEFSYSIGKKAWTFKSSKGVEVSEDEKQWR